MRPIMFSTVFPSYHPRKGQPTYFPEKIVAGLVERASPAEAAWIVENAYKKGFDLDIIKSFHCSPKWHTIRAGNRWKAGDYFSPRLWSKKPYRSPQVEFAPPIRIEKVWPILMTVQGNVFVDGRIFGRVDELAKNDGLTGNDLNDWFPVNKHFEGQIICWNNKIVY